MLSVKAFAQRVKRTRPDVAVNDAEAGETEESQPTRSFVRAQRKMRRPDHIR